MNSRRFMPDIGLPPASAPPVYRTLNLSQSGWQVLGPDLNCSESEAVLGTSRACDRKDSTPSQGLLRCGISMRPMSALGQKQTTDLRSRSRECPRCPQKRTSRQTSR
jgi:hypothetical protein